MKGELELSNFSARLFDYKKLFEQIKKKYHKNQKDISLILDCSEVHVSNVKNEKVGLTTDQIVKLVNAFDLCLDDYVVIEVSKKKEAEPDLLSLGEKLSQDEKLLVLKILQLVKDSFFENQEEDEETIQKKAGANIKKIRRKKKIEAEDMARYLSMRRASYLNIENGSRGTSMDTYIQIAKKLEVPVSKIFSGVISNRSSEMEYDFNDVMSSLSPREKRKMIEIAIFFQEILSENNKKV